MLLCLAVGGCASTPTVEEANAERARIDGQCIAKGYKRGTSDFYTCVSLTLQQEQQSGLQKQMAIGTGIGLLGIAAGLLSDERAKQDMVKVGSTSSGLNLYRFRYVGERDLWVGVSAQEVLKVRPDAVVQGSDGYLRVYYARLGLKMTPWDAWKQ